MNMGMNVKCILHNQVSGRGKSLHVQRRHAGVEQSDNSWDERPAVVALPLAETGHVKAPPCYTLENKRGISCLLLVYKQEQTGKHISVIWLGAVC